MNINQQNNTLVNIKHKNSKMNRSLIICLVLIVSINLYSQNKTIKGRIIDENLETLPYVSIVINDTVEVEKTDLNGFFQIDIPISVKNLLFRTVGIESAPIKLVDKCDDVEVVMMSSGTYDFIAPKKVDKLRLKRFKKLSELHKEAFEKSIFKTDKACYTQTFIPFYKR